MFKYGIIVLSLFFGSVLSAFAQELSFSGKLRVLQPMEIRLETLEGEKVLTATILNDQPFTTQSREIRPDVYILWLGKTKQPVYLTNTEVTMKGYYDEANPAKSSLIFSGIDEFLELSEWIPEELNAKKRIVKDAVRGKLRGTMYSALAYISDMDSYASNKMLLEMVPASERDALSAKWLARRVDSLSRFSVGAEAYDFEYVDPKGENVRLSDFRGKLVLVDFWASWCGPCRQEMKNLLPIYNELKGDDLEFVSVSLDKREKDWRKMLDDENLPWVMLWNKEGFTIGNEPNTIQRAFGFYSIPFIVLVDKDGRILERGLRGMEVKEAILKARHR